VFSSLCRLAAEVAGGSMKEKKQLFSLKFDFVVFFPAATNEKARKIPG
jgi:hypothetical protein